MQADVEVTFSIPNLEKAEPFDPSWKDPRDICYKKKSKVRGAIGPFGLLAFATEKLEEFTPVFFRIFKAQNNKHVVLMCSDAEPSVNLIPPLYIFIFIYVTHTLSNLVHFFLFDFVVAVPL